MPKAIATASTTRNRKLECPDCGYVVRTSRKMIARGFPGCPCGGRLMPWDLDDVLEFMDGPELEAHPVYRAYLAEASSIMHGQAWRGGLHASCNFADPDSKAMDRVYQQQRVSASERRLQAILPAPEALPF